MQDEGGAVVLRHSKVFILRKNEDWEEKVTETVTWKHTFWEKLQVQKQLLKGVLEKKYPVNFKKQYQVFANLGKIFEKHQWWSLLLVKLQASRLYIHLRMDSFSIIFQRFCLVFKNTCFTEQLSMFNSILWQGYGYTKEKIGSKAFIFSNIACCRIWW